MKRRAGLVKNCLPKEYVDKMYKYYLTGKTLAEVGAKFGNVSAVNVRGIFERRGYSKRRYTVTKKLRESRLQRVGKFITPLIAVSEEELRRLYLEEETSLTKMAKGFKVNVHQIKKALKYYNIPIRGDQAAFIKKRLKNSELTDEKLTNLKTVQKLSPSEIAALFEYSRITIYRKLDKNGLVKKSIKPD